MEIGQTTVVKHMIKCMFGITISLPKLDKLQWFCN